MNKQELFILKYKKNKRFILFIQIAITLLFIITWELFSYKKIINPFIFSSPTKIIKTITNLYINNQLFYNILITLKEIFIAFSLGFIISFIIALLLYSSNILYKIIDPFITIFNSLPKVALGPILIIFFGTNYKSIIVMGLLINVIVCIESLYVGFNKINKNYLLLFKSYKANKFKTIIYLIIPNSIENIISSLKLNISMSLIGLLPPVGEKIFFNKCYSRY